VATIRGRSRTLWSSFSKIADFLRIAREVVPGIIRTKPVTVPIRFLVGPDCGRACQLVAHLAQSQGYDLIGGFDDASGDEWGSIRLPHSGIIARFPTASYGPYIFGPTTGPTLPPDYAKTLLAGMHQIGQAVTASHAWRTRALPDCAKLVASRSIVRQRVTECLPDPLPNAMGLMMSFNVEAVTAVRFLKTCPGLSIGSAIDVGYVGGSTVSVIGSAEAISRALQAPFQVQASWGCEPDLD